MSDPTPEMIEEWKNQPHLYAIPKAAPMNWQEFVEMATADGWGFYGKDEATKYQYLYRRTVRDQRIRIWADMEMDIWDTLVVPAISYELALAAANAVAEAVGGWR